MQRLCRSVSSCRSKWWRARFLCFEGAARMSGWDHTRRRAEQTKGIQRPPHPPLPPPLTHLAALSPPDMTARSREQSSRIEGHRRAAGRVDSTRSRGASGRPAEEQQQQQEQQQPRGGRIAVSGDERQGQCGSQQADRGEEAAEICDTSPLVPHCAPTSIPSHPDNMRVDASMFDQWWLWYPSRSVSLPPPPHLSQLSVMMGI